MSYNPRNTNHLRPRRIKASERKRRKRSSRKLMVLIFLLSALLIAGFVLNPYYLTYLMGIE